MFRQVGPVEFPELTFAQANMMPIIMGDDSSIPRDLRQYAPLVNQCTFRKGSTVYLSVTEGFVTQGQTQRRAGIHTEGIVLPTGPSGWGGVPWGGGQAPEKGIYMASTNGLCRIWDCLSYAVDHHGALEEPDALSIDTEPNVLYWITDRTPHEALPQLVSEHRQWFRLVADEIGVWYAQHSTPNPLGIRPNAPIEWASKF